jgi:hypothetical protein
MVMTTSVSDVSRWQRCYVRTDDAVRDEYQVAPGLTAPLDGVRAGTRPRSYDPGPGSCWPAPSCRACCSGLGPRSTGTIRQLTIVTVSAQGGPKRA